MNVRLFIALVLLLLVRPALAPGDELCFVPSLAVTEEKNTNLLLATDPDYIRSDYITTLSPGFELTDRTARLDLFLSIQLDRRFYGQYEQLDATNELYRGRLRYDATELLRLSADAVYQKVYYPRLYSVWVPGPPPGTIIPIPLPPPPGDPGGGGGGGDGGGGDGSGSDPPAPEKEILPLVTEPIERVTTSLSAEYRLTDTTMITAGYGFGQSTYQTPSYHDTSHELNAGLGVDLSASLPRVRGNLNMGYGQYILPNSRTINVMGTLGFSYKLDELWNILIDGGIRRTQSEITVNKRFPYGEPIPPLAYEIVVEEKQEYADWGRVGHLSLNYHGEYIGTELLYVHDFTMVTLSQGYQAPAERNALSVSFQYRITGELSASLSAVASTFRHPANIATETFKQDSVSVSPLLRYDFSRELAIEASYEHSRYFYKALDTEANREVFFIRLSARFPFCSSSQYQ